MQQRRYTKKNLTIVDAVRIMSNGNKKAEECLKEMLKHGISGTLDILMIDSLKIYGQELAELWKDCDEDPERLHEVMDTYRTRFTKEAS